MPEPAMLPAEVADLLIIDQGVRSLFPLLPDDHVIYGDAAGWDLTPEMVAAQLGSTPRDPRCPDLPELRLPICDDDGEPLPCPIVRVLFVGWDDVTDAVPTALGITIGVDGHLSWVVSAWIGNWSGWAFLGRTDEELTATIRFRICYARIELRELGDRTQRSQVKLISL